MHNLIEKRLDELIPSNNQTLFAAARYSLLAPGKRIRPLLTLAAAATFDINPKVALDAACAIEMIHTYSLIHDDLPCMDDDDLRRGRATLHKIYPEAIALLTGDYLLTYAFEILAKSSHLSADLRLSLIEILSQQAGSKGMIGGQLLDIESVGKTIDDKTLFAMHQGKTGALFIASLQMGGKIGKATEEQLAILKIIGEEMGIAYQFLDDLLNVTSSSSITGKTTGSDAAKSKPTAVSLFGIEKVKDKLQHLLSSIDQNLEKLPQKGSLLKSIIDKTFSFSE